MKIKNILIWTGLLIGTGFATWLCNWSLDGMQRDMQPRKIGDHARVIHGYYSDCTGEITKEWWTEERHDREGRVTPSFRAGWLVDLTCDGQDIGERTFTDDFLRRTK